MVVSTYGIFRVANIKLCAQSFGEQQIDVAPYLRLLSRIEQQFDKSERGDLLVFLPGQSHINILAFVLFT